MAQMCRRTLCGLPTSILTLPLEGGRESYRRLMLDPMPPAR